MLPEDFGVGFPPMASLLFECQGGFPLILLFRMGKRLALDFFLFLCVCVSVIVCFA